MFSYTIKESMERLPKKKNSMEKVVTFFLTKEREVLLLKYSMINFFYLHDVNNCY
jgi:hypothetical protein